MKVLQVLSILPFLAVHAFALPTGEQSMASATVARGHLDKRACDAIYRRAAEEDSGPVYPEIAMADCAKLTAGDSAEEDDASILPRDVAA